jgi:hypothetical protein
VSTSQKTKPPAHPLAEIKQGTCPVCGMMVSIRFSVTGIKGGDELGNPVFANHLLMPKSTKEARTRVQQPCLGSGKPAY